jgi:hypothetical protein
MGSGRQVAGPVQRGSTTYKPVIGRLGLAVMRTGMRLVNHIGPLKRKMLKAEVRNRDHTRQDA